MTDVPTPRPARRSWAVLRDVVLIALAVLVADVMLPRSVAVSGLYVLPVLLSLWLGDRRDTVAVATICTGLTVVGFFFKPGNEPLWYGVANRAIVLFAIWATAGLGVLRMSVESELRRSRQTIATTLAGLSEAVVTADASDRVDFLNAPAEALTGWRREDAVGRPLADLLGLPRADLADDTIPASGETTIATRSGERIAVEASLATIRDPAPRAGEAARSWGRVLVLRDVRERKRREEAVRSLAYRDPLTGLANRHSFEDRLDLEIARARRSGERLAILFLDLDDLKEVNDTLGHAAGDALLKGVADRLRATLREQDTVARIGGDEFVVLLPGLARRSDVVPVVEKILVALDPPHRIERREVRGHTSIGVAVLPDDATDAETLLRRADAAMYRAKSAGGARWSARPVSGPPSRRAGGTPETPKA